MRESEREEWFGLERESEGWKEKKVVLLPLFANERERERERERANGTLDDGVILLFDVLK